MISKICNEYCLQSELINTLISQQYPEESFMVDWKQGDKIYNLAIFDPETKTLLAVFEYLISSPVVISSQGIREKIEKYRSLVSDPKVHLYIVSAVQDGTSFLISKILYQTKYSDHPHFIKVDKLPSFEELKNKVLTKNMDNDFSKMTDEELEGIIRLHENSNIPGSRFQRALTEMDLRYKKRLTQPSIHFEVAGDMTMDKSQVFLGEGNKTVSKKDDNSTKEINNIQKIEKTGLLERITNNQTFANVIGGLFLLCLIYLVYKYLGINLSNFR